MKKGISKLLLIGISLTSFSVHAVDIAQVLDATDNLSIEDQAELIFLTAIVKAIDINKAIGVNDKPLIAIPLTIVAPFLASFGVLLAGELIDAFIIPNSISHFNEKSRVSDSKEKLKKLNSELGRYITHRGNTSDRLLSKKAWILGIIDDYRNQIDVLSNGTSFKADRFKNYIIRWKSRLEEVENQLSRMPIDELDAAKERRAKEVLKRKEVQKQLNAAKHDLRLMRAQKGFFYKIGRIAYGLKKSTIGLATIATGLVVFADTLFIVASSEKDMNRIQKRSKKDIELLIEKSNALFLEDYDI